MQNESIMSENENMIYEISFIFDNKLEGKKAEEKLVNLKELIASNGGSFISEETPYKRELAYEMVRVQNNKNIRFNEGYFGWVKFEMLSESILVLDKTLKLDEEVVRYLIVKTERGNNILTRDQSPILSNNFTNILVNETVSERFESVNIDTTNEVISETTEEKEFSPKIENQNLEDLKEKE